MAKLKKQQALPFRLSYLDVTELIDRLITIYNGQDNFDLKLSNDRYVLYAKTKLTKEQLRALKEDPAVYSHYDVPGDEFHMGAVTPPTY